MNHPSIALHPPLPCRSRGGRKNPPGHSGRRAGKHGHPHQPGGLPRGGIPQTGDPPFGSGRRVAKHGRQHQPGGPPRGLPSEDPPFGSLANSSTSHPRRNWGVLRTADPLVQLLPATTTLATHMQDNGVVPTFGRPRTLRRKNSSRKW